MKYLSDNSKNNESKCRFNRLTRALVQVTPIHSRINRCFPESYFLIRSDVPKEMKIPSAAYLHACARHACVIRRENEKGSARLAARHPAISNPRHSSLGRWARATILVYLPALSARLYAVSILSFTTPWCPLSLSCSFSSSAHSCLLSFYLHAWSWSLFIRGNYTFCSGDFSDRN